jgi:SulP family sulfate permease
MISSAPPSLTVDSSARLSTLRVVRNPRLLLRECLAGIMTSLALVPEVISFSVVAGVEPQASLLASVVLGVAMSVLGGRAAMVTAAAGSVALVVGPTVHMHGPGYVLPMVLLAGVIQVAFGLSGLARLMRYVPRSVTLGFVNALGILIFMAQVPHVSTTSGVVAALFALTLGIVQLLPRLTRAVPAPLVALAAATTLAAGMGLDVARVGDGGSMTRGLPGLTPLTVPLDLETLSIIAPAALSVAFVGLLESLLTAQLVDELTATGSNKSRESWALGIANLCAGLYGGIAGCAMIGQTVVNVELGGARTRISTAVAALVLLSLVTGSSYIVAQIPMVALAAVMMLVALKTVNWSSLRLQTLERMPVSETLVMAATVVATVCTGNLAIGVVAGVVLAMLAFAVRASRGVAAERQLSDDGLEVRYAISGPLFFGSSHVLAERFSFASDPDAVSLDFTRSQLCDAASVAALEQVVARYRALGSRVTLTGLDAPSERLRARLSGRLA